MAKRKSSKKKKRIAKVSLPKRKKKDPRPFWRRAVPYAVAACFCAALFTAAWVDRQVVHRLIEQRDTSIAAVYTDNLSITPRTKVSPQQLRDELLVRGYAEVSHAPKDAGEFTFAAGKISGIARRFVSASGAVYEQQKFDYPFASDAKGDNSITLEPRILAPLMSGEQRAHRFKSLKEIPLSLRHAVVAIEDERFYRHMGVDVIGIARAMFINLRAMAFVQGGSTLTQQLAKNTLFSRKRALSRKVMEALAALSIEQRLSKDRILELYLNEVYLGQEGSVAIHGAGAASMTFFGKPIEELSLAQSALIAGIIQAPSAYAPRKHLKRALERQRSVLSKMEELGYITAAERAAAEREKIQIVQQKNFERRAPFFVDSLRTALGDTVDLESSSISGLKVYTGINYALQECAEKAVSAGSRQIERTFPNLSRGKHPLEISLLALDPASGLVRAWVGGHSYAKNQFDRVSLGLRQAGSTVKPFLYLTALDAALNHYKTAKPTSILSDEPLTIQVVSQRAWEPENFDKRFRGDVSLRYALENSLNLPAVYVSQKVGIDSVAHTFELFRLGSHIPAVPSIALGSIDTTLQRLTAAYAALANGGHYVAPRLYTSANDSQDRVIAQTVFEEQTVASEDAVFVLTHILRGVIERGTGHSVRSLGFQRPAAGKTGTSDESRDAWFVGFTPTLAAGVWLGFDDNRKFGLTGGKAAVPIWTQFMRCAEGWVEDLDFVPPPGVEMREIDTVTGKLAAPDCPSESIIDEAFVAGTEPRSYCPEHSDGAEATEEEIHRHRNNTGSGSRRRRESPGFWQRLFG